LEKSPSGPIMSPNPVLDSTTASALAASAQAKSEPVSTCPAKKCCKAKCVAKGVAALVVFMLTLVGLQTTCDYLIVKHYSLRSSSDGAHVVSSLADGSETTLATRSSVSEQGLFQLVQQTSEDSGTALRALDAVQRVTLTVGEGSYRSYAVTGYDLTPEAIFLYSAGGDTLTMTRRGNGLVTTVVDAREALSSTAEKHHRSLLQSGGNGGYAGSGATSSGSSTDANVIAFLTGFVDKMADKLYNQALKETSLTACVHDATTVYNDLTGFATKWDNGSADLSDAVLDFVGALNSVKSAMTDCGLSTIAEKIVVMAGEFSSGMGEVIAVGEVMVSAINVYNDISGLATGIAAHDWNTVGSDAADLTWIIVQAA